MSTDTAPTTAPANREKLRELALDVFLLEPEEFSFELRREDVETWDSLGVVSFAVGIEEVFGYHLTPEEATGLTGIPDVIAILESKGIPLAA
jgi:acyl carrier protein